MLKTELYNYDTIGDPSVTFATDAEIELAEQLRRVNSKNDTSHCLRHRHHCGCVRARPLILSAEYRVRVALARRL